MAVLPIDLQALFATSVTAGQEQAATREAPAAAQAAQAARLTQQTELQDKAVNDARDVGDGPEKTDEDSGGSETGQRRGRGRRDAVAEVEAPERAILKDPDLGQHIDVVG